MIMMIESVDIGATGDKISDLYKFTIKGVVNCQNSARG